MIFRVFLALSVAALAACGKGEPPKSADPATKVEQAARQIGEGARQGDFSRMGEGMKQMGSALSRSVKVEPVDFRLLKEWLPVSLAGMKRTGSDGSKRNVMGIASSKVEAGYEDGKGGRLALEVTDMGTLNGVAAMALAWVNLEIDKEGDSGYERTTTVNGRKAYERYAKATRSGDLDVIVAGRFLVGLKATGVEVKVFEEAIAKLDLDKLDALKSQGVPAEPSDAPAKK